SVRHGREAFSVLTRRRIDTFVQVRMDREIIKTKRLVGYIGVTLDNKLTIWNKTCKQDGCYFRLFDWIHAEYRQVSGKAVPSHVSFALAPYGCEI
ncbi:hypothetical protein J6590_095892, partial [Homalodisca vitripennis]